MSAATNTSEAATVRKPRCFIAMPVTTRTVDEAAYGDSDHWNHVMEELHVRAVEGAGYEAIRPVAEGSIEIRAWIVECLTNCELVLVDLSSLNPNVYFEMGIRTAVNKPMVLVFDGVGSLPFDTSGINTYHYDPGLRSDTVRAQLPALTKHIEAMGGADHNEMWKRYGMEIVAQSAVTSAPSLEQSTQQLILERVAEIERHVSSVPAGHRQQTTMLTTVLEVAAAHPEWSVTTRTGEPHVWIVAPASAIAEPSIRELAVAVSKVGEEMSAQDAHLYFNGTLLWPPVSGLLRDVHELVKHLRQRANEA